MLPVSERYVFTSCQLYQIRIRTFIVWKPTVLLTYTSLKHFALKAIKNGAYVMQAYHVSVINKFI